MRSGTLRLKASIVALAAATTGCLGGGEKISSALNDGLPEVIRAESLNQARRGGYGLVEAPELERYLNDLAQEVAAAAGHPDLDVLVKVSAASEFNAAAFGDGLIVMTMPMLNEARSEDEIAFWLAHELVHVIERHHNKDVIFDWQEQAAAQVGLVNAAEMLGRATLASAEGEVYGEESTLDAWHRQAARVAFVSTMIISPAWTRGQEDEADRRAFELVAEMGYDLDRPACAMRDLAHWEGEHGVRYLNTLRAATADLQEKAFKHAQDRLAENAYSPWIMEVGRGAFQGVEEAVQTQVLKLSSQHLGAGKRETVLKELALAAVEAGEAGPGAVDAGPGAMDAGPGAPGAQGRVGGCDEWRGDEWQAIVEDNELHDLFKSYSDGADILYALSECELDRAEDLTSGLLIGPARDDVFPNLVLANLALQKQDSDLELTHKKEAARRREDALIPHIQLSEYYERQDDLAAALEHAEEGYELFSEAPEVLPNLIRLHARRGEGNDAKGYLLHCQAEHAAYLEECQEAAREGISTTPEESGSAVTLFAALEGIDEQAAGRRLSEQRNAAATQGAAAQQAQPTPNDVALTSAGSPDGESATGSEVVDQIGCQAQQIGRAIMGGIGGILGGDEQQEAAPPEQRGC